MKKIILIGMLTMSALTFADKGNNGNIGKNQVSISRVEICIENLTEKQKRELKSVREAQRREIRKMRLNIREVDLEIEREMRRATPRRRTINKLIEERGRQRVAMEKKMVYHKFQLKKKFGIEIRGFMFDRNGHKILRNNRNKNFN